VDGIGEPLNDKERKALLSDLEPERPDVWQVQATQHGRVLWKREVKGKSQAGRLLNDMNSSFRSYWIHFISKPQDLESWLPKKLLESKLKFRRPNLSSLCAISSLEGGNHIKYYLDAKTGNRYLVLTYETKPSGFVDSKIKSIREYSVEDELISERKFVFPERKDDPNVILVELTFDRTGIVSATKSSILESATLFNRSPFQGSGRF